VRKNPAFLAAPDMIRGALRRDPEKLGALPRADDVVVYCVHGHEVSQGAAKALGARYLEGGIEHWDGERMAKPVGAPRAGSRASGPRWTASPARGSSGASSTRTRSSCTCRKEDVLRVAKERSATPYDVPDVELTHVGGRCSFDAFVYRYHLRDPALAELATIVRGADTNRPDLAPQSAGLVALSLGLSALYADDHEMLEHGMTIYDALYAWCASQKNEVHAWNPALVR
jgi:hypothetical protein